MLSHHDQVLLDTLTNHSLLELVPLFKQDQDERFAAYLETYHHTITQLQDERASRELSAFAENLKTFLRTYLNTAQRWDVAFLETMAQHETTILTALRTMDGGESC